MKNYIIFLIALFFQYSNFAQADKTMYLHSGLDGTIFVNEEYFLDSSDVPSMIQHPDGTIVVMYQCFKGGMGSSGWDKVGVRFSSDDGNTWTTHQSINVNGLPGSSSRAFDPTITVTSDNKYRLYFSYCPNTMMLDSTCDTYSALSTDGINFTVESGQRVDRLNAEVIDPALTYFNSTWHYSHPFGGPGSGARHATSSDGLNFTVIDTIGSGAPNYINWTGNLMDNGSDMRFYGSSDNSQNKLLWWSSSVDGSSWSSYNWTNAIGKDPAVLKTSSGKYIIIAPRDSTSSIGIEEINSEVNCRFYPNPASSKFVIESTHQLEKAHLYIYNSLGERINELKDIHGNSIEVNIQHLNNGIYFLKLIDKQRIILNEKLIITDN